MLSINSNVGLFTAQASHISSMQPNFMIDTDSNGSLTVEMSAALVLLDF